MPDSPQELLERWVAAIESKDLGALAKIFRDGDDVAVFWSNGERTVGWPEVRRHIETDFRKEVDLSMQVEDLHTTLVDGDTCTLTYRYGITVAAAGDAVTCSRLASMTLHRGTDGWRIAALHVSTAPDS